MPDADHFRWPIFCYQFVKRCEMIGHPVNSIAISLGGFRMMQFGWVLAFFLVGGVAGAQSHKFVSGGGGGGGVGTTLPEAPEPQAAGTASVSGTVLDVQGNGVPGAKVTLSGEGQQQTVESDALGVFHFVGLPAGMVRVNVTAKGLETFLSNEIKLTAGEHFVLPRIDLPVAPLNSDVTVTITEDQLATEQVHEQEQQRLLGVVPNFYTSYLWDAAPMRSKQKYQLIFRSAIDPFVFVTTGIRAGISQARNTDPGYGSGGAGFARRYGAAYGDAVTGRLVGSAILPSLFHQDPRYFFMGSGSIKGRAWYAVTRAVVTRGDSGKNQPNYSAVLGSVAGAGLRNLYLDPDDRSGPDVLYNGLIAVGFNGVGNLVREFLFVKIVKGKAGYKVGKPVEAPASSGSGAGRTFFE